MITLFNKLFLRARFVVPICMSVLIVSCSNAITQATQPTVAEKHQYSGEDYYLGIFTGSGEVVNSIPEIRDHQKTIEALLKTPEIRQQHIEFQKKIMRSMESIEPNFFQKFKSAMESGDHLRISSSLASAAKISNKALQNTSEYKEFQDLIEKITKSPDLVKQEIKEKNAKLPKDKQLTDNQMDDVLSAIKASANKSRGIDYRGTCIFAAIFFVSEVVAILNFGVLINIGAVVNVAVAVAGAFWIGAAAWTAIATANQVTWDPIIVPGDPFPVLSKPQSPALIQEQMINTIANTFRVEAR